MTQPTPMPSESTLLSAYHRARILLTLASLVCFVLFYAAARLFGIPFAPGYTVSLLQQPGSHAAIDLLVILILLILSVWIGSGIAGSIRRDAGLLAACFGLTALSFRGGTMAATLQAAPSSSIFATLAIELVLLYAFLLLAHLTLAPLRASHFLPPDHLRDGVEPNDDEPLGNKLLATAAQVLGMLILLLLLAQTQDKMQAITSVFLAALLATAAAHSAFPVEPSIFFWIGPAIVGLIGYAYAAANPGTWIIGLSPTPLAVPLPLDYASAGPAGALMGYWMSRHWQRSRETHITPPDSTPPASDAHMPLG